MSEKNTGELEKEKLFLRSYLAANQTVLADERTLLAYIRTALTLFVAGVTFIKFFDHIIIQAIGWIFIPTGIITFIIGLVRYNKIKNTRKNLNLGHI